MRLLILVFLFIPFWADAQSKGEIIFKSNCASCHTIGKGNLVGPDLEGLMERRDESWVRRFIQSSQSLLAEGDSLALALFQENNYVPMPDQLLSEEDLTAVLDYINAQTTQSSTAEVDKQMEPKATGTNNKQEKIKHSVFKNFINRPINWIFTFALLVIISVFYTLLKVIQILAEYNIRKKDES